MSCSCSETKPFKLYWRGILYIIKICIHVQIFWWSFPWSRIWAALGVCSCILDVTAYHSVRTSLFTGNFGTKNQRYWPRSEHLGRGRAPWASQGIPGCTHTQISPLQVELEESFGFIFGQKVIHALPVLANYRNMPSQKLNPLWHVLRNYLIFLAPVWYFIGQELGDKCSVSLYGFVFEVAWKIRLDITACVTFQCTLLNLQHLAASLFDIFCPTGVKSHASPQMLTLENNFP